MTGRDYLRIWYVAQMGATVLFMVAILAREIMLQRPIRWLMAVLLLAVLVGFLIEIIHDRVPNWVSTINNWLQAICQPLALIMVWGIVSREIILLLYLPARGILSITVLYYFVMFAPFAGVIGARFHNVIARIILLFYWLILVVEFMNVAYPTSLAGPHFLKLGMSTGFFGSIAYLIMVTTLMRVWQLSWPGLTPHWHDDISVWVIIFLVVVDVVYTLYNGDFHFQHGLLSGFHYPGLKMTLQALETGIGEETFFRFGLLGVLLYALQNFRFKVPTAIIISAVLFGLSHLMNLAGQRLDVTLLQVFSAFGCGLFFACVYLYTGQLWLTMLMHFLIDWTAVAVDGTFIMTGSISGNDWLVTSIQVVIDIAIFVWMLFGKRRHALERHSGRFVGDKQRFDYRLPNSNFH
ncbi:lysostaphin resistance A-like protein [Limosilactobacillus sp.]|uniref:CPBP family intramembrane glutamic endopeptidase n=1 Tax=Limosilactobacillus sp. TaxID=2773925 RepID=UPI00345EB127